MPYDHTSPQVTVPGHILAPDRTEHPADERAGDPRPLRPPGHRHALPDRQPSHQRTRPSPLDPPPGESPGRPGRWTGCTLDSAAHVKPEHATGAARPWPSVESRRCTPTVLAAGRRPLICPWTPRHRDLQRYKVTHDGTEKKRPASREFAASGPFSQVVAGVGFEPTSAEPTVLQYAPACPWPTQTWQGTAALTTGPGRPRRCCRCPAAVRRGVLLLRVRAEHHHVRVPRRSSCVQISALLAREGLD